MEMKLSHVAKYLRPAVQAICLTAVVVLFLNIGHSSLLSLANNVVMADPIMTVSSILFYKGVWFPLLISVSILIAVSYLIGRAFCGWICPVGFLIDLSGLMSKLISKLLKRKPNTRRYGYAQYGILAAVILLSLVSMQALSLLDPFVIFRRSMFMVANAGLPDVLLLILLGSVVVAPRFFCRAICPAGAILGLAALVSPFKFKAHSGCINCNKCVRACDMGAISKDLKWDATACIKCLDCERKCPKKAISFSLTRRSPVAMPAPPAEAMAPSSQSRRALLAAGAAAGVLAMTGGAFTALAEAKGETAAPLIRPPGALVEDKFNAACIRCESCAQVCPSKVIELAGIEKGLEKLYTPVLNFRKSKCYLCGKCMEVCPNGTIVPVAEEEIKIGTAEIDTNTCYAWHPKAGSTQTCMKCRKACKYDAITGEGSYYPQVVDDKCVGCGRCELACPVKAKAIVVTNKGERRREV
jgi:ferredoxin-type protein NapH